MEIGNRIKQRREELGISAEALGEMIGKAKTTIYRYENGFIESMPSAILEPIAKALRTTPAYLMGWTSEKEDSVVSFSNFQNLRPVEMQKIPMLGKIACGKPIYAEEEHECYVAAGSKMDADFCLVCQGDSMTGAGIQDGSIVFIKQQESVDNGQIAAVIIGEEATLKRVYYFPESAKLVLQAENPRYEPLVYTGEELNGIKILGKAIAYMSALV